MEVSSDEESFARLERLVKEKKVQLVFVLGLPRGGTTALEKFVYEKIQFDGQINEPSLLGPPPKGKISRIERTFARVLAHVQKGGIFLVKEVTNKVLPEMIPLWYRVVYSWIIVVRNPLLQLESRLKSMLDRIDSGALEPDISADENNLHVHGYPCLVSSKDTEQMTWRILYNKMKNERNFSNLRYGALRACLLHPFCQWRECQKVLWGREENKDPLPLEEFDTLTESEAMSILEWRLGWSPLVCQLDLLESCLSQDDTAKNNKLYIFDFSDIQNDAGRSVLYYFTQRLGLDLRPPKSKKDFIPFETCANKADWTTENWNQWYAAPCFDKVERSAAIIETSNKVPIPLSNFPRFLNRNCIPNAIAIWLRLLTGPLADKVVTTDTTVDPLYNACCQLRRTTLKTSQDKIDYPAITQELIKSIDQNKAKKQKQKYHYTMMKEHLTTACVALTQFFCLVQCLLAWIFFRPNSQFLLAAAAAGEIEIKNDILSIIIPALNEANNISTTIAAVFSRAQNPAKLEIILVDASSTDDTVKIAQDTAKKFQQNICILNVKRDAGRGKALRLGAHAATGSSLFFLHADTIPPFDYDLAIRSELSNPNILVCAFRLGFSSLNNNSVLRLVAACANFRSIQLRLPFGDQGLGLTKSSLYALHGFDDDHPIMEDAALVLRARSINADAVTTLHSNVLTSPRRFLDRPITSNLANAFFLLSWHLGWAKPDTIFRAYYGIVATTYHHE